MNLTKAIALSYYLSIIPFLFFISTTNAEECLVSDKAKFQVSYSATADNQTNSGIFTFNNAQLIGRTYDTCPGMTVSDSNLTFAPSLYTSGDLQGQTAGYNVFGDYTVMCFDKLYNYKMDAYLGCPGYISGIQTGTYSGGREFQLSGSVIEQSIPTATVQSVTGEVFNVTLTNLKKPTASDTVPDTSVILTLKNSTTTIKRADESIIEIKPETLVVLNPIKETTNKVTLVRGEVTSTTNCSDTLDYEVHTSVATIKVPISCTSTQRAATTAQFTSNYSQDGLDGTLTVSVVSGTVDITERDGNVSTLVAGDIKVIQNTVPRTSWVLPIDGDKIYGGVDNMFVWTAYPGAVSYKLEYNLPIPIFAEENSSTIEFSEKILPIAVFKTYDDLIIYNLPLPSGLDGSIVEVRIYALDASGSIIGESVSSDRSTITWED